MNYLTFEHYAMRRKVFEAHLRGTEEVITVRSVKGCEDIFRVGNGKLDSFGEMNGYYIRTDGRKAS